MLSKPKGSWRSKQTISRVPTPVRSPMRARPFRWLWMCLWVEQVELVELPELAADHLLTVPVDLVGDGDHLPV
jgi:hypothetical protein